MTCKYIIAPDGIYLGMDNSPVYWPVSEANLILCKEIKQYKHAELSKAPKLYAMATQRFKPGDKVKFTQEAKDRFKNDEYWQCANYERLNLDRVYTIKSYNNEDWPSYSLEEKGTAPHTPDYLLEPAEEEKPSPCDTCEVVRKLQAEIQRLKYELDQVKAEKSQTKASPRKGEPWMKKFNLPNGGHGLAFGFEW